MPEESDRGVSDRTTEEGKFGGPVTVSNINLYARLSLQFRPTEIEDDGGHGPNRFLMPINTFERRDDVQLSRLGPEEWLLWVASEKGMRIANELSFCLRRSPHSIVDVTDRYIGFSIAGSRADAVANGSCPLDLRPTAFHSASVTRSVFGGANVVVSRARGNDLIIECERSFATHVHSLLLLNQGHFAP